MIEIGLDHPHCLLTFMYESIFGYESIYDFRLIILLMSYPYIFCNNKDVVDF